MSFIKHCVHTLRNYTNNMSCSNVHPTQMCVGKRVKALIDIQLRDYKNAFLTHAYILINEAKTNPLTCAWAFIIMA